MVDGAAAVELPAPGRIGGVNLHLPGLQYALAPGRNAGIAGWRTGRCSMMFAQVDPRVLYCNRTGAAVSNDAIWSRDPADRRRWNIHALDLKLQRSAAVSAVMDDFGDLVEVAR